MFGTHQRTKKTVKQENDGERNCICCSGNGLHGLEKRQEEFEVIKI